MREKVRLACTICLSRNYTIEKKKTDSTRIEMVKFCPKCKKHTIHKETK